MTFTYSDLSPPIEKSLIDWHHRGHWHERGVGRMVFPAGIGMENWFLFVYEDGGQLEDHSEMQCMHRSMFGYGAPTDWD